MIDERRDDPQQMSPTDGRGEGQDDAATAAPQGPDTSPAEAQAEETIDPRELGIELPDDPQEAIALLLRELRDARQEAETYLTDLQRITAEFQNFRKRMLREQAENVERASERLVRALLPVLDSFDAALAIEPETPTERKLLEGMRSTHNLLLDVLGKEGLEVIHAKGEDFDPEIHEAVQAPSSGEGKLIVTDELRRGYRFKGKVLRAPLVAVDHE